MRVRLPRSSKAVPAAAGLISGTTPPVGVGVGGGGGGGGGGPPPPPPVPPPPTAPPAPAWAWAAWTAAQSVSSPFLCPKQLSQPTKDNDRSAAVPAQMEDRLNRPKPRCGRMVVLPAAKPTSVSIAVRIKPERGPRCQEAAECWRHQPHGIKWHAAATRSFRSQLERRRRVRPAGDLLMLTHTLCAVPAGTDIQPLRPHP